MRSSRGIQSSSWIHICEFLPPGTLLGFHSKYQRKSPSYFLGVWGGRTFWHIPEYSVLLNNFCAQEKHAGLYQSLTDLREGKCPTPACFRSACGRRKTPISSHTSHLVSPGVGVEGRGRTEEHMWRSQDPGTRSPKDWDLPIGLQNAPVPPLLTTTLLKIYLRELLLPSASCPATRTNYKTNQKAKNPVWRGRASIRTRLRHGKDVGMIRKMF